MGYDVSGERDAGIAVIFELSQLPLSRSRSDATRAANRSGISIIKGSNVDRSRSSTSRELLSESKVGSLLIVSMAGMVAESLRFGDSRGGVEDFPVALAVLRSFGVGAEQSPQGRKCCCDTG